MEPGTHSQPLPDLTLVDGHIPVESTGRTPNPRLLAAESAMVQDVCSMLSHGPEKPDSDEAALKSMLNYFGFGPIFTVI